MYSVNKIVITITDKILANIHGQNVSHGFTDDSLHTQQLRTNPLNFT